MESDPSVLWSGAIALKGLAITVIGVVIVLMLDRRAALRHLVATLAIVSVLVLPFMSLVLPAWNVSMPKALTTSHAPIVTPSHTVVSPARESTISPRLRDQTQAVPRKAFEESTLPPRNVIPSPGRKPLPWPTIAIAIWITGIAIALGFRVSGWLALARLWKRSEPELAHHWSAQLSAAKEQLGIRRHVELRRSEGLSIPVTFGALRPLILLPPSSNDWPTKRQKLVLLHELAHIKRFDWLTQTLGQIACAMHWFNPLAWWLLRQMDTSREFACDDLTISTGAVPSDYAQELLHFVHTSRASTAMQSAAVPMARQSNIEQRVRRILHDDRARVALTVVTILLAIVGCAVVLLPLASMHPASENRAESEAKSLLTPRTAGSETAANEETNVIMDDQKTYTSTRAGISEAIRAGNLAAVKRILTEKPELLHAENPYNWANLEEMRVWPWASKPAELAVIFGHTDILKYLLSLGETEDHPLEGYFETFDIANKAKNEAAIDVIVADVLRRANQPGRIHATTDSGRTFLHFAAEYNHVGLMEALLARGAEADARQNNGRKPIHMVGGDNAATRLLLKHGAEFDLWVAAAMGDLSRARAILAEDTSQVAIDFKPYSHHSDGMPLVAAAERGHLEMVRLLLDHGADVDGKLPGREFGDLGLGLTHSLSNGHLDVVELLLDRGADTSAWVDSSWGFKDRLRESSHEALKDRVLTEVEKNPPVKSPSFKAWTGEIHGDIRQLPPPSPKDALGRISAAIVSHNRDNDYENYKEIITVMLEQGADQNASMKPVTEEEKAAALKKRYWHREYGTPLHWLSTAYLNKHNYSSNPDIPTVEELVDLAGLFVDYDANLEARHPISNHTPLSSAVAEGIYEYVDLLLEKGAQIHRDDPPETNPIIIAEKLGLTKIAQRLNSP